MSTRSRVPIALFCLHVSAAIYAALGLVFLFADLPSELSTGAINVMLAAVAIGCAVGVELVAYGIRKRRFWGWVAGLVVFGMYVPSLFFPLGALGLWGLPATGSRAQFGMAGTPR